MPQLNTVPQYIAANCPRLCQLYEPIHKQIKIQYKEITMQLDNEMNNILKVQGRHGYILIHKDTGEILERIADDGFSIIHPYIMRFDPTSIDPHCIAYNQVDPMQFWRSIDLSCIGYHERQPLSDPPQRSQTKTCTPDRRSYHKCDCNVAATDPVDSCPECEGTNLNTDTTKCWDCSGQN